MIDFFKKAIDFFTNTERKKVRARTKDGKFIADDESTPDVNEAYKEVRVQKKTKKRGKKNGVKKNTRKK